MDAEGLYGFVYYTTYTQAQGDFEKPILKGKKTPTDNSFLVYSVEQNTVNSYNNEDLTLVFLNVLLNSMPNQPLFVPDKSSHVYDFSSSPSSSVMIYWNEPGETYKNPKSDESQRSLIFSNPISINGQHFDSVEPFNIFNDIWYWRAKGQFRFQVKSHWEDPNGSTTSKTTTTGMVMCSFAPENLTVNMISNPANAASSGMTILYNVINPLKFEMTAFGIGIDNENRTTNNHKSGSATALTTFFRIRSAEEIAGHFSAQYFQIEGAPLPSTTPGSSTANETTVKATTTTVPTTTKSASQIIYLSTIVIMLYNYI